MKGLIYIKVMHTLSPGDSGHQRWSTGPEVKLGVLSAPRQAASSCLGHLGWAVSTTDRALLPPGPHLPDRLFWQAPGTAAAARAKFWPRPPPSPHCLTVSGLVCVISLLPIGEEVTVILACRGTRPDRVLIGNGPRGQGGSQEAGGKGASRLRCKEAWNPELPRGAALISTFSCSDL